MCDPVRIVLRFCTCACAVEKGVELGGVCVIEMDQSRVDAGKDIREMYE
jgi:hypothetical protein